MARRPTTETKPVLPPHLVALFERNNGVMSTTMREPVAVIRDVTPAGYGPRE